MQRIVKPTLTELIDAYTWHQKSLADNSGFTDNWYEHTLTNNDALYNVTQPDYDQGAFKTLIDSIELNGLSNFNMTTFIGNIDNWLNDNNWASTPISEFTLSSTTSSNSKNAFDSTTAAFNCSSVGCIAGFAVANAVNWQQPKWMKEDSRNYLEFFENVACNWLNIPINVGRRIFYGDSLSVWSFVRFHEPRNYGSIEWSNFYNEDTDVDSIDYDWDEYKYDLEVKLETINYKYATDVLRRIASGEIVFNANEDFEPTYSKQYNKRK